MAENGSGRSEGKREDIVIDLVSRDEEVETKNLLSQLPLLPQDSIVQTNHFDDIDTKQEGISMKDTEIINATPSLSREEVQIVTMTHESGGLDDLHASVGTNATEYRAKRRRMDDDSPTSSSLKDLNDERCESLVDRSIAVENEDCRINHPPCSNLCIPIRSSDAPIDVSDSGYEATIEDLMHTRQGLCVGIRDALQLLHGSTFDCINHTRHRSSQDEKEQDPRNDDQLYYKEMMKAALETSDSRCSLISTLLHLLISQNGVDESTELIRTACGDDDFINMEYFELLASLLKQEFEYYLLESFSDERLAANYQTALNCNVTQYSKFLEQSSLPYLRLMKERNDNDRCLQVYRISVLYLDMLLFGVPLRDDATSGSVGNSSMALLYPHVWMPIMMGIFISNDSLSIDDFAEDDAAAMKDHKQENADIKMLFFVKYFLGHAVADDKSPFALPLSDCVALIDQMTNLYNRIGVSQSTTNAMIVDRSPILQLIILAVEVLVTTTSDISTFQSLWTTSQSCCKLFLHHICFPIMFDRPSRLPALVSQQIAWRYSSCITEIVIATIPLHGIEINGCHTSCNTFIDLFQPFFDYFARDIEYPHFNSEKIGAVYKFILLLWRYPIGSYPSISPLITKVVEKFIMISAEQSVKRGRPSNIKITPLDILISLNSLFESLNDGHSKVCCAAVVTTTELLNCYKLVSERYSEQTVDIRKIILSILDKAVTILPSASLLLIIFPRWTELFKLTLIFPSSRLVQDRTMFKNMTALLQPYLDFLLKLLHNTINFPEQTKVLDNNVFWIDLLSNGFKPRDWSIESSVNGFIPVACMSIALFGHLSALTVTTMLERNPEIIADMIFTLKGLSEIVVCEINGTSIVCPVHPRDRNRWLTSCKYTCRCIIQVLEKIIRYPPISGSKSSLLLVKLHSLSLEPVKAVDFAGQEESEIDDFKAISLPLILIESLVSVSLFQNIHEFNCIIMLKMLQNYPCWKALTCWCQPNVLGFLLDPLLQRKDSVNSLVATSLSILKVLCACSKVAIALAEWSIETPSTPSDSGFITLNAALFAIQHFAVHSPSMEERSLSLSILSLIKEHFPMYDSLPVIGNDSTNLLWIMQTIAYLTTLHKVRVDGAQSDGVSSKTPLQLIEDCEVRAWRLLWQVVYSISCSCDCLDTNRDVADNEELTDSLLRLCFIALDAQDPNSAIAKDGHGVASHPAIAMYAIFITACLHNWQWIAHGVSSEGETIPLSRSIATNDATIVIIDLRKLLSSTVMPQFFHSLITPSANTSISHTGNNNPRSSNMDCFIWPDRSMLFLPFQSMVPVIAIENIAVTHRISFLPEIMFADFSDNDYIMVLKLLGKHSLSPLTRMALIDLVYSVVLAGDQQADTDKLGIVAKMLVEHQYHSQLVYLLTSPQANYLWKDSNENAETVNILSKQRVKLLAIVLGLVRLSKRLNCTRECFGIEAWHESFNQLQTLLPVRGDNEVLVSSSAEQLMVLLIVVSVSVWAKLDDESVEADYASHWSSNSLHLTYWVEVVDLLHQCVNNVPGHDYDSNDHLFPVTSILTVLEIFTDPANVHARSSVHHLIVNTPLVSLLWKILARHVEMMNSIINSSIPFGEHITVTAVSTKVRENSNTIITQAIYILVNCAIHVLPLDDSIAIENESEIGAKRRFDSLADDGGWVLLHKLRRDKHIGKETQEGIEGLLETRAPIHEDQDVSFMNCHEVGLPPSLSLNLDLLPISNAARVILMTDPNAARSVENSHGKSDLIVQVSKVPQSNSCAAPAPTPTSVTAITSPLRLNEPIPVKSSMSVITQVENATMSVDAISLKIFELLSLHANSSADLKSVLETLGLGSAEDVAFLEEEEISRIAMHLKPIPHRKFIALMKEMRSMS